MAALASSAVALYPAINATTGPDALSEIYPAGKGERRIVERSLKLTLTGQGGQTNTIGASALGFVKLLKVTSLWDAQNSKGYPAVVDPVNNVVILLDGNTTPTPVDVSSTAAYIRVTGVPTGLA